MATKRLSDRGKSGQLAAKQQYAMSHSKAPVNDVRRTQPGDRRGK